MTEAQLFCKYVNLTLMLTDSLYWLGIYQIELDGLHDWSMCSLILQVVRCNVSGVYLIWVSGGYWLTAVNISQHNLNHLRHTSVVDSRLEKYICINNKQRKDLYISHFQQIKRKWQKMIYLHLTVMGNVRTYRDGWVNVTALDETLTTLMSFHNTVSALLKIIIIIE